MSVKLVHRNKELWHWRIEDDVDGTEILLTDDELRSLHEQIHEILPEDDPPTYADMEARTGVSECMTGIPGPKTATEKRFERNSNDLEQD